MRVGPVLDFFEVDALAARPAVGSSADQDHLVALGADEESTRLLDRLVERGLALQGLHAGGADLAGDVDPLATERLHDDRDIGVREFLSVAQLEFLAEIARAHARRLDVVDQLQGDHAVGADGHLLVQLGVAVELDREDVADLHDVGRRRRRRGGLEPRHGRIAWHDRRRAGAGEQQGSQGRLQPNDRHGQARHHRPPPQSRRRPFRPDDPHRHPGTPAPQVAKLRSHGRPSPRSPPERPPSIYAPRPASQGKRHGVAKEFSFWTDRAVGLVARPLSRRMASRGLVQKPTPA